MLIDSTQGVNTINNKVSNINSKLNILSDINNDESSKKITGSNSFEFALNASKELLQANKEAEATVNQKTLDFMTGKDDNIVDLMVAQEKSSILLNYTLQVRNGLVSAYKEIMSMQI